MKGRKRLFIGMLLIAMVLSACAAGEGDRQTYGGIHVLATTSIVGDVLRQVAGDAAQVDVLLPIGTDPHHFEPTPQDVARVTQADLIFANGAGLEEFLRPILENAGDSVRVVYVSDGIQLLEGVGGSEHTAEGEQSGGDPHTWLDPNLVMVWTQNIEAALVKADPSHADTYKANAEAYRSKLQDLDGWIREQVAQVPQEKRLLVSDHTALTYFASRYGFQLVGAVIPGYSTLAEPSARDISALQDTIRKTGVKIIFVEMNTSSRLPESIAQDLGIQVIPLAIGTLTESSAPAPTYIDLMRYDVTEIVGALK